MKNITICITVDLEDWFQVENLRSVYPLNTWNEDLVRFQEPLNKLLILFDKYNIKATFFALGWIAERFPEIIRQIHNAGHEIASHGMSHRINSGLTDNEVTKELSESKRLLEKIIKSEVVGYRAPSFTISDTVIELLKQNGYKYDSSYFPFKKHGRYGKLSEKALRKLSKGYLNEFSIPLGKFLGLEVPFAGGAYFRILPLWLLKILSKKDVSKPLVFYFHPWEFDNHMPKIKDISLSKKIRHYTGVERNLNKLEKLVIYIEKESSVEFKILKEMLS